MAAVDGATIWMVADTAVTGGTLGVREREHTLKVRPARDGSALIGFAGDLHHGSRIADEVSYLPCGQTAVAKLIEEQRRYPSVHFAYAYVDENGPHLLRITDGEAVHTSTLNIGMPEAFEHFQRIRHDPAIDPIPLSVGIFLAGSRAVDRVPEALIEAISAMLKLFSARAERDIGGAPIGYFVNRNGAYLCGYGYSISDPILHQIGPGAGVPHGTAEAGGFGLSVMELGHGDGVVVYWLQLPGGTVYCRNASGYAVHQIVGSPLAFKVEASAKVGKAVEVWFGCKAMEGRPDSLTVFRDEHGVPSMVLARQGDVMSFSVLNVSAPFRSRARVDLQQGQEIFSADQIGATLSKDRSAVTIGIKVASEGSPTIELQASELDAVLSMLGEVRAAMRDPVSGDPPEVRGAREVLVVDPAWHTTAPWHPSLNGIVLKLRHLGFGWLSFILPNHEAQALGEWLTKHSQPRTAATEEKMASVVPAESPRDS